MSAPSVTGRSFLPGPWNGRRNSASPRLIIRYCAPARLRRSIGHRSGADWTEIGSNSDVARWQEFGTDRIPPRSFLGRAMAEQGRDEARRVVGRVMAPLFLAPRAGPRRP